MPKTYNIPGVYVEEITKFPPSVAQVETAIPAFIGYTEFRLDVDGSALAAASPVRISSLTEFEARFGRAPRLSVTEIRLDAANNFLGADISTSHYLYHALQLFYSNGGGDCYIVSVGGVAAGLTWPTYATADVTAGITALEAFDEPTMICFPDAASTSGAQLYSRQNDALLQCANLGDRVLLCDLYENDPLGTAFRSGIGINNLKYGMAYSPWLRALLPKNVSYREIGTATLVRGGATLAAGLADLTSDTNINALLTAYTTALGTETETQLSDREFDLLNNFGAYKAIVTGLNDLTLAVPPSGAIAGVIASVDRTRGVWKAPANVSINGVLAPVATFTQAQLGALNVDVNAGKSINAIRAFTGKGTLVFGARTLAGNDNEWRYVNVRRFYNMVEESIKKATVQFVFEPNDSNTWVRVQAMIENFLSLQWRAGALQGAKQEQAFQVAVGLGKTMTALDILEGRMIVQIAMAPVRPAEFIILRFEQKMPES
ncbi:MAG: phage tail sheath family protein [Lewinella sp.]|nr:phage tail sheath family protein [Lewinella sp.]